MSSNKENPLGNTQDYQQNYSPDILFAIPRSKNREALGLNRHQLPFRGFDLWNAYEVSWLNGSGRPVVAVVELTVPCVSRYIIESKSLKLYFNSLNFKSFESKADLVRTIETDIESLLKCVVAVNLIDMQNFSLSSISNFKGKCLDDQDLACEGFEMNKRHLENDSIEEEVSESLFTHLFRSLCPVTGQPDWASVLIRYKGRKIDHAALLQYLLSYRGHQGYHEDCVERIYLDLIEACEPEQLTVYARFSRRGGIDINPFRSNYEDAIENCRLARQ